MGVKTMNKKEILRKQVVNFMLFHKGKENAISSDKIVQHLNHLSDGKTHVPLRDVIKDVIFSGEYPIASCSKGYFMAVRTGEVAGYLDHLQSRMDGNAIRMTRFRRAAYNAGIYDIPF